MIQIGPGVWAIVPMGWGLQFVPLNGPHQTQLSLPTLIFAAPSKPVQGQEKP